MLPHCEFRSLRLRQFARQGEVIDLQHWRYDERDWIGEAVGFTEWLRPANDPANLGSLALHVSDLPPRVTEAVMRRVGLPLRAGMTLDDVAAVLGRPVGGHRFASDRQTYEYVTGQIDRYRIDCTIHATEGLVHVVIEPTSEPTGEP